MGGHSSTAILKPGAAAPIVRLSSLSGSATGLRELAADGPAVVAFFKISCPVCQLTMPFLERLKQGKLRIVGISQDDAESTADFNREFRVSLETLLDSPGYPASNGFGISQVPTMFQVEPGGTISHAWEGFSKADMEALGERAGMPVFRPGERVPAMRPG